jgi:hypothetical protein
MNIPIRMIGIATTIFWVFLIIFSITAAYSVKDLQFGFGEPQMIMTPQNELLFTLPINIYNRGYYNIGRFNVTTEISDANGNQIIRGSSFTPVIRKDEKVTILHNVTLDFNDLLQFSQTYLFTDSELNIAETIGLSLAEVIPVQASGNFSIPWGAPLYNFRMDEPQYAAHNFTHLRVSVPISFENHAFFDVVGTIQVSMYNSSNQRVCSGQTSLNAPQHSPYSSYVELYIMMTSVTPSGRFEVNIQTPLFSYGPWVIPYG